MPVLWLYARVFSFQYPIDSSELLKVKLSISPENLATMRKWGAYRGGFLLFYDSIKVLSRLPSMSWFVTPKFDLGDITDEGKSSFQEALGVLC